MAYIHNETFDIIQNSNAEDILAGYFEVDDLLALPIQALNRKGYTTTFSCAGHAYETINEYDGELIKDNINRFTDIVFADGVFLPNFPCGFFIKNQLPDGTMKYIWENEDGNVIDMPLGSITLTKRYDSDMGIFEFLDEQLNAIKTLMALINTLDFRK